MRKDRYSALLMANMAARCMDRAAVPLEYKFYGGFATGGFEPKDRKEENPYQAPKWFSDNMKDVY